MFAFQQRNHPYLYRFHPQFILMGGITYSETGFIRNLMYVLQINLLVTEESIKPKNKCKRYSEFSCGASDD